MSYTVRIKDVKKKNKEKIKVLSEVTNLDYKELENIVCNNLIVLLNVDKEQISKTLEKLTSVDIKYSVSMPNE